MTIWEVLGIEPTQDKAAIKNAYRQQLSLHHPEEDPDGFKQVREAYEQAIAYGEQPSEAFNPNTDNNSQTHASSSYAALLQEQLHANLNSQQRLDVNQWRDWLDRFITCPIEEQAVINEQLINSVLDNHWLPGEIVALFWNQLGWDTLLNSQESVKAGQFLQAWGAQKTPIDLDELCQLSAIQQQVLLTQLRPLLNAFDDHNLNALHYWMQQPSCLLLPNSPSLKLFLLRIWNIIGYPNTAIVDVVNGLLTNEIEHHYSASELEILGQACLNIRYDDAALAVVRMMIEQNELACACDLLRQLANQRNDIELSHVFAFLQHRYQPLPEGYWQCEYTRNYDAYSEPQQYRLKWYKQSLIDAEYISSTFRTRLDFYDQDDLYGDLFKGLWGITLGSWSWLKEINNQLVSHYQASVDNERPLDYFASELVLIEIQRRLHSVPGTEDLKAKFDLYESDEFLTLAPLSEEELQSLNSQQWSEFLMRHPLTPDSWFFQLIDSKAIQTPHLQEIVNKLGWSGTLYMYRYNCYDNDYSQLNLSSIFHNTHFEGVFDWTLLASSLLRHEGDKNRNLAALEQLKTVPESHQNSFGLLTHVIQAEGHYQYELAHALTHRNDCNLLISTWAYKYVRKIAEESSTADIINSFQEHVDPLMYAALTWRLLQENNLPFAMLMWSCFVPFSDYNTNNYLMIERWLYDKVHNKRDEEGLTKDFYSFYEPEIIYSLTQSQFEDLTPTQGIDLTRGDKEHRRFVLPAYYMALQLRYAVDMETMDKSATEALLYWQDKDEHDWRSHAAHILLTTYIYMLMNWRKLPEHEIYENYVVTSINPEEFD